MIVFDSTTWTISLPPGESPIARQFDNLTRSITVTGVPEGWDWTLLVQASGKLDLIALETMEGGVGVTLTAQMLAINGLYSLQLRGTQGELVRHTNVLQGIMIPASLSGSDTWPTVPSEFTQLEQRVQALAAETETAADQAQAAAEGVAANAQAAQEAAGQAQTAQDAAQSSAQQAGTAAAAAADGAKTAADSAAAATQAAQSAGDAVRSAQASAQTATAQAQAAADAAQQAGQAQTAAETAAGSAEQSAANADRAAQEAQQVAQDAKNIIDDTKAQSSKTWSSLTIVDRLAPAFEVSGPVVTCNPVKGYPLHVVSQIVLVQEGEGEPSPDNVRPIKGWDSATLSHNSAPITLQFGQTIYGGTLDWTTGVLTLSWKKADLSNPNLYTNIAGNGIRFGNALDGVYNRGVDAICNYGLASIDSNSPGAIIIGSANADLYFIGILTILGLESISEYEEWATENEIVVIYKSDNPITIQLTPQEILALSGANTIYANTGDTTVSGRAEPNTVIQQLAARIAALEGAATKI